MSTVDIEVTIKRQKSRPGRKSRPTEPKADAPRTPRIPRLMALTVTDPEGRRHSVDVIADSTYDAAHLSVVEAKQKRQVGLPKSTLDTIFEVVTGGKVFRVAGAALQRWIVERREKWKGPKGYFFRKRPGLRLIARPQFRSEEHTSELQSRGLISY